MPSYSSNYDGLNSANDRTDRAQAQGNMANSQDLRLNTSLPTQVFTSNPTASSFRPTQALQQAHEESFSSISTANTQYAPIDMYAQLSRSHSSYNSLAQPSPYDPNAIENAFAQAQVQSPLIMNDEGSNLLMSGHISPHSAFGDQSYPPPSDFAMQSANDISYNFDSASLLPQSMQQTSSLNHQQCQSPYRLDTSALSSSNNLPDLVNGQPSFAAGAPMTAGSPLLTINPCEDLPTQPSFNEAGSQPRRRSTIVNGHLSPFLLDDDQHSIHSFNESQYALSAAASVSEHDTWHDRHTGGWSPVDRGGINSQEIPSLNEQTQQRIMADRNADIEDWLHDHNLDQTTMSDASDHLNRPRAQSTNDPHGPFLNISGAAEAGEAANYFDNSTLFPPFDTSIPINDNMEGQPAYIDVEQSLRLNEANERNTLSYRDRSVPETVNTAIMSFDNDCRKRSTHEATITAAIGTLDTLRPRSVSDLGSLRSQPSVSRQISAQESSQKNRVPDYFSGSMPMRSPSLNAQRKRKSGQDMLSTATNAPDEANHIQSPAGHRRISNPASRSRTPRRSDAQPPSAGNLRSPVSASSASENRFRNRSKSDIGADKSPGISNIWKVTGDSSAGMLAVPARGLNNSPTAYAASTHGADDDDEVDLKSKALDVILDMHIVPTQEGFREQIDNLNPAMDCQLRDRLVKEQMLRYTRLMQAKQDHAIKVEHNKCGSNRMCAARGGQPQPIVPNARQESAPIQIFRVLADGEINDGDSDAGDALIASFRQGIPNPPAHTLPARFECPVCFQPKDIHKPSDWTKHMDEDVQPFTCTFPDCSEPRSFKRKADWVRHESEKHRQPDVWTCKFEDCTHECCRRDNFVQHLIREHGIPDPKIRTGRHGAARVPPWSPETPIDFGHEVRYFASDNEVSVYVNKHVDNCKTQLPSDPMSEPCRFCGTKFETWKKLQSHLARHMEQIAMPVLKLVQDRNATQEASLAGQQLFSAQQTASGQPVPSFMFEEPAELSGDMSQVGAMSGITDTMLMDNNAVNQFNLGTEGESFRPITYPIALRDAESANIAYATRQDMTHPQLTSWPGDIDDASVPSMILTVTDQYNFDATGAQQQAGHSSLQHQYFTQMNQRGN